jgi:transcriptional regulator with XRE-family HTH domain
MTAFGKWLENQRVTRGLTVGEFARFLGIGDTTLRSFIRENEPLHPGRSTLLKIAEATHTPLSTLIDLTDPESAARARSSASAQLLAEMIESLDEDGRKLVETLVDALLRQKGQG